MPSPELFVTRDGAPARRTPATRSHLRGSLAAAVVNRIPGNQVQRACGRSAGRPTSRPVPTVLGSCCVSGGARPARRCDGGPGVKTKWSVCDVQLFKGLVLDLEVKSVQGCLINYGSTRVFFWAFRRHVHGSD